MTPEGRRLADAPEPGLVFNYFAGSTPLTPPTCGDTGPSISLHIQRGRFFVEEARDVILRAVFQDLMSVQRRHA